MMIHVTALACMIVGVDTREKDEALIRVASYLLLEIRV